jgi:hypothetical protein
MKDSSYFQKQAARDSTDPMLQISERKFQSESIAADLCLGVMIAGVSTQIGIAIGLIIVIRADSSSP